VSGAPFPWVPGEHVAIIGDTGTGKTYLTAKALLPMRRYVVVFKTKIDKDDADKWRGFHRIRKASSIMDGRHTRFLLQPEYTYQAREGWNLCERVYRQGGWTIVIDELLVAERIGLADQIERLLTQGRSTDITVVVGQQRPVGTSRFVISQCTHLFSFRVEGRDTKTVAEATTPRIVPVLDTLSKRQFAYYNRAERVVGRGTAATLGGLLRFAGTPAGVSQGAKISHQPT